MTLKINRQKTEKLEVIFHNLMISPFTVYSLSYDQLRVLKQCKKNGKVLRASIDSTGNIVRTPHGIDGEVLYTAGVINISNKDGKSGMDFH